MRRAVLSLATLLLSLTAWAAAPSLQVADAWIRWLPGAAPAGGYLTLINDGDRPAILDHASSDDYASVSLHQSHEQDGVSSMTPVDELTVAPHSRLVFENYGYHLMLMQPRKAFKAGDTALVRLHFADGRTISVSFPLRSPDMLMSK